MAPDLIMSFVNFFLCGANASLLVFETCDVNARKICSRLECSNLLRFNTRLTETPCVMMSQVHLTSMTELYYYTEWENPIIHFNAGNGWTEKSLEVLLLISCSTNAPNSSIIYRFNLRLFSLVPIIRVYLYDPFQCSNSPHKNTDGSKLPSSVMKALSLSYRISRKRIGTILPMHQLSELHFGNAALRKEKDHKMEEDHPH